MYISNKSEFDPPLIIYKIFEIIFKETNIFENIWKTSKMHFTLLFISCFYSLIIKKIYLDLVTCLAN